MRSGVRAWAYDTGRHVVVHRQESAHDDTSAVRQRPRRFLRFSEESARCRACALRADAGAAILDHDNCRQLFGLGASFYVHGIVHG